MRLFEGERRLLCQFRGVLGDGAWGLEIKEGLYSFFKVFRLALLILKVKDEYTD